MEITKEEALVIYIALLEQIKKDNSVDKLATAELNIMGNLHIYLTK